MAATGEQADALTAAVGALRADLGESTLAMERRTAAAETQNKKLQRAVQGIATALVGVLALTGVGVALWVRSVHNADRIGRIQEVISVDVLCPLYEALEGAYRPELQPPEELAEYEATFALIFRGSAALNCEEMP